jgi:membrane protein
MTPIERWKHQISESGASAHGWFARTSVFWVRLASAILMKFGDKNLHLQSTSLAYTTLLSLVPFLAVTFSVLKGFGVQNQLRPMLMQSLEPLGEKGIQIGESILTYVDNLNFAVLGFMGVALLFWTVISLLTKVEEAFNAVWHVPGTRSLARRFSDYLSVALVGPVFVVTALGVTAGVLGDPNISRILGTEPLGRLFLWLGQSLPYLLVCAAFAFLYAFLTNCRVRLVPALIGGVFASVAWYGSGHLFALLVASSSKYSAIYSTLAAAVLFIIWVNIGWLIILVGSHIARYWQHPHLLRSVDNGAETTPVHDDACALHVMALIGHAFYFDEPKWTLETLAARGCCGPPDQVHALLRCLTEGHLILATSDEPVAYLPARSIENIALAEIVDAVCAQRVASVRPEAVKLLVEQIDAAVVGSLQGRTLRDLVLAVENSPLSSPIDPEQSG